MEFQNINALPIDIKEAIRTRKSVRSYEAKSLSEADKQDLMDFYATTQNPFGVKVNVQYISKENSADNIQLGTYGTIKGAKDFLAITVKDEPYAMVASGYQFEELVLYATSKGLGTVWLAATFSRKDFEKAMHIEKDDLFPCISPVGYPTDKKSILERITRVSLGSTQRKAWEKIFFEKDFNHPMTQDLTYQEELESFRLAPSSTNGQPWAVVKDGNTFHFFNDYKNSLGEDVIKIKNLDLGIGLCHFHQTALANHKSGKFVSENINFEVPENMHYIISYQFEN